MTSSSSITEITRSSPQLPLISWTQGNYTIYDGSPVITKHARLWQIGRCMTFWQLNQLTAQHQLPDSVSMFVGRIWRELSTNWLSVENKMIFPGALTLTNTLNIQALKSIIGAKLGWVHSKYLLLQVRSWPG